MPPGYSSIFKHKLRVVQFWSEIILVISNRTRATRSFDFEITRMISDQIALHSVQLPLYILWGGTCSTKILNITCDGFCCIAANKILLNIKK